MVHAWRASLEAPPDVLQQYRDTLIGNEVTRADRFCFERDCTRFTVAPGVLRAILGRYLHRDPACLRFRYNRFGKPEIDIAQGAVSLCFNMSHSADLALYAVALGREVGVDVEEVRDGVEYAPIAAYAFSPNENEALRMLTPHQRTAGFFNCWTRKEAYIKARGMGLSLPLNQFDVSLVPGEPAALLRTIGEPEAVRNWSLQELALGPDFIGAVAAGGHDLEDRLLAIRAVSSLPADDQGRHSVAHAVQGCVQLAPASPTLHRPWVLFVCWLTRRND